MAKRVAIVTGGTRGIGKGITEALVDSGNYKGFVLTYNTNKDAASKFAEQLASEHGVKVEIVGGDLSETSSRDAIFECYDKVFKEDGCELGAVVHNAGQYLGVTSDNSAGIQAGMPLGFGNGTMLAASGGASVNMDEMKYYQRLYGDAYVDLCERSLARMTEEGAGTLIGISSPGCTESYKPNEHYDMPGAGKSMMHYAMRLFAVRGAAKNATANVVVPGVTHTEAWDRVAMVQGAIHGEGAPTSDAMKAGLAEKITPYGAKGTMTARQCGDVVAFLCSPQGHIITGVSLPADCGVHLKI